MFWPFVFAFAITSFSCSFSERITFWNRSNHQVVISVPECPPLSQKYPDVVPDTTSVKVAAGDSVQLFVGGWSHPQYSAATWELYRLHICDSESPKCSDILLSGSLLISFNMRLEYPFEAQLRSENSEVFRLASREIGDQYDAAQYYFNTGSFDSVITTLGLTGREASVFFKPKRATDFEEARWRGSSLLGILSFYYLGRRSEASFWLDVLRKEYPVYARFQTLVFPELYELSSSK